ncbi:SH2 domain-containing protein 1A [Oryzias melastigma]|uniref:SH2 domain-containing protein 1A n=1 Tax=Oryzias melastigma TaxID=30732 RepID=A0A834C1A8_ORYME|nr:SH2 domain-containing protein 1A [Oryzias melastigma]
MEREGIFIQSIYYGKIGRMVTERLLERFGHDGSFLLRDSETSTGGLLSLREESTVCPHIQAVTLYLWLVPSGESLWRFEALESLINHYRRVTVARVVPLTAPLDKTQIPNGICEEFLYMEINCNASKSND